MDDKKKTKTGRLANRTIMRMLMLALVLIVGIGAAVASIFWQKSLQTYADFSYSYTRMAADFIDGDKVSEYVETGKTDDYYNEISRLLNVIAEDAGLRYLYVVIPQENGMLSRSTMQDRCSTCGSIHRIIRRMLPKPRITTARNSFVHIAIKTWTLQPPFLL